MRCPPDTRPLLFSNHPFDGSPRTVITSPAFTRSYSIYPAILAIDYGVNQNFFIQEWRMVHDFTNASSAAQKDLLSLGLFEELRSNKQRKPIPAY